MVDEGRRETLVSCSLIMALPLPFESEIHVCRLDVDPLRVTEEGRREVSSSFCTEHALANQSAVVCSDKTIFGPVSKVPISFSEETWIDGIVRFWPTTQPLPLSELERGEQDEEDDASLDAPPRRGSLLGTNIAR